MNKSASIRKNAFFIVGCPRSGTTLLQSILSAHSSIYSAPESHFFYHLLANRGRWRSKMNLASPNVKHEMKRFFESFNDEALLELIPEHALFAGQYANAFFEILQTLTEKEGKHTWIEKTPRHIQYINEIESFYGKAKFIHIIRSGEDVVASLYEVTHKYPNKWEGARDIDYCIKRWIRDVKISLRNKRKPNHLLLPYEQLVENTQSVVQQLCKFLEMDFEPSMLSNYKTQAKRVSLSDELWKATVSNEIQLSEVRKFDRVFDSDQKSYIRRKLATVDINEQLASLYNDKTL